MLKISPTQLCNHYIHAHTDLMQLASFIQYSNNTTHTATITNTQSLSNSHTT